MNLNTDSSFAKLYDHWFGKTGDPNAAATMVLAQVQADVAGRSGKGSHQAMSVSAVAQILGVSNEMVYKLCAQGDLGHKRIGRRIIVTPHQLAEYQQQEDY